MPFERRLKQHEGTISRYQKIEHLRIAIALGQPLAYEKPQVAREWCFRIINRLILADHATQPTRQIAGPCFKRRIFQYFIRLHRQCRLRYGKPNEQSEYCNAAHVSTPPAQARAWPPVSVLRCAISCRTVTAYRQTSSPPRR